MRLNLIYDNLPTKISWLCLFLLLFAGCSDEISKESYTSETVIDDLADTKLLGEKTEKRWY
ncbi:hypothetical protein CMK18_16730 [Candidatus Poribacteria bacterium]|nr:hypothetical protein [Candidatus Poribacteria bacterium]